LARGDVGHDIIIDVAGRVSEHAGVGNVARHGSGVHRNIGVVESAVEFLKGRIVRVEGSGSAVILVVPGGVILNAQDLRLKLLKVTASNVGGTTAMPTRERRLGSGGRSSALDGGGWADFKVAIDRGFGALSRITDRGAINQSVVMEIHASPRWG
jgi:hypothetical protein